MRIVIVRHGIAQEPDASKAAQDDALRELTKQGRQKMRKTVRGLRQLVKAIDVIASSPLIRAAQTADILSAEYDGLRTVQIAALSPKKPPAALVDWLNAHPPDATIALIGHEPSLGIFLCWLLTGLQESFVQLKKGGVALIEISSPVAPGRAKLHWLLKPSQLRALR